jgi:hypothetical protein
VTVSWKKVEKLCDNFKKMDLVMEEDPELCINNIKEVAFQYVTHFIFKRFKRFNREYGTG